MRITLDEFKWSLIVSSPVWAMFGLFLISFNGLYPAWEAEPLCAVVLMLLVLFAQPPKKKFKEISYEQLPPEKQKEFDNIKQIIEDSGGKIESFKIESDEND